MDRSPKRKQDGTDTYALLEMARTLAAACDLDKLLQMVVDYSMSLLDAERATLFLYDGEREELFSRIAEGTDEVRISVNTGLAGAAALSLQIVNVPDAYQDERFNREIDKQTGYRTRNILACPLVDYNGQLVGVLQILNKRDGSFSEKDIELAEALSAQAGVALQRASLLEHYLEKQRLEHTLEIAKEIQQKLFPQRDPALPGYDIAVWNRPCDATGGDCCDFLRLGDERLVLTLGDVTGHGVGPALVSCAARAMLRAMSSVRGEINFVMQHVNNLLSADLSDNRFVTVFLGILDAQSGQLNYCSAGQGPLVRFEARRDKTEVLSANAIPMGIVPGFEYEPAESIIMEPGDLFVLLTDGFYEWAHSDGQLFGVDRVLEVIKEHKDCSSREILEAIIAAVETFADTKQADDLTAIILKRESPPA